MGSEVLFGLDESVGRERDINTIGTRWAKPRAAGEAYCRSGLFSCTNDDENTCRGETAVLYCFADQPLVLACDDWDARCEGGECVGVAEGGFCTEPLIAVMKLHVKTAAATMLRRLDLSAKRAIGIPALT